jgi:hypothetical protein
MAPFQAVLPDPPIARVPPLALKATVIAHRPEALERAEILRKIMVKNQVGRLATAPASP